VGEPSAGTLAVDAEGGGAVALLYTVIAVVAFVGVASAANGFVLRWHFPDLIVAAHRFATAGLVVGAVAAVVLAYRSFARRDGRTSGTVFAICSALAIAGTVQLLRDVDRDMASDRAAYDAAPR
jgi:hypothetical protein